ncbi:MAG: cytochrome P450, partial [Candidatus Tectomicrobia bacterium]|nr:cytochrome P450 [Candidatus Tectomicrobia bacterium]
MEAPGPEGAALHETIQALRQEPLDTLLTLQRQFGDVVCLRTSPSPVYLLSHPDAVQHVLYDRAAQYRKGILFQGVAALQGQGLLTSAGALWQQQRRMLRPPLHPRQLARLGPLIQAEIHAVVQAWQQAAESGTPVQVSAWMQRFAFRVMGRVLLGLPS